MEYRVSKASTVSIIATFTRHRLSIVSSSAYFPWNMTFKYKMQLSEGSWIKSYIHVQDTVFSKEDKDDFFFSGGLSLEGIHQRSGSSFRDFL